MTTWQQQAASIIADVHKTLPSDADLKTRKRALTAAKPPMFACTSWGRKTWSKAATEYLSKHGYQPRTSPAKKPHLSPLERMKSRAEAA